jgi:hypothetical protein
MRWRHAGSVALTKVSSGKNDAVPEISCLFIQVPFLVVDSHTGHTVQLRNMAKDNLSKGTNAAKGDPESLRVDGDMAGAKGERTSGQTTHPGKTS